MAGVTLPRCFGVLGDPVGHSRSPRMHAAAFAALGLPHRYLAFHVGPGQLREAVAGARALGFGGLNLTVPHKQAGLGCVDVLGAAARRIGAVNTLCFGARGVVGENTDGLGFAAALAELGGSGDLGSAVVLGAGGAALAVVDALVHEGLLGGQLRWVTREPEALAPVIAARPWLAGVAVPTRWEALVEEPVRAELLVNCTSVGMVGGPVGFPGELRLDEMPASGRVVDAVYPRPTGGLLARAEARGLAVQDGLPMLLWQGVRALERWLEISASAEVVAAMRAALFAENLPDGPGPR
jgi:shikimate dehydrogenase